MKRQKITDRHTYDIADRMYIGEKSGYVCAHCGTQLHILPESAGGNATVDHFVPISKGGINHKLNTIMLCRDCNRKKSQKIVSPYHYIRYLKPEYRKEIEDYFESYIHSFEYISRKNLLCCDEYIMKVYCGPMLDTIIPKKRKEMTLKMTKYFTLQRAYPEDLEKLEEFFISYLKKYHCLAGEDIARKNVEFWSTFGAIYFITDRNDEIKLMVPITMGEHDEKSHNLNLYLFSMYSNITANRLAYDIPWFIATQISSEQDLPYLRIRTLIQINDPASQYDPGMHPSAYNQACMESKTIYWSAKERSLEAYDESKMEFYKSFHDAKYQMDWFFRRPGYGVILYMGDEIIEGYEEGFLDNQEASNAGTA